MSKYLLIDEINTRLQTLASDPANSGIVTVLTLDKTSSADSRDIKCVRISKAPAGQTPIPVLIIGGVHAREWAPPDSLVDFAERLVKCFTARKPYTDPRFVYNSSRRSAVDGSYTGPIVYDETPPNLFSLPDVDRVIQKLELFIVPCVNPDGRDFSQQPGNIPGVTETGSGRPVEKFHWRKNRKDYGTCADGGPAIGVDINRNFDLTAWNIENYFKNGPHDLGEAERHTCVTKDKGKVAENFFQNYHGPSAASENETHNIQKLILDKKIKFFLDVHAFQGEIYWPWGFNPDQTAAATDATKSQLNTKWDNVAANAGPQQGRPFNTAATYSEFFPTSPTYDLLDVHQKLAGLMAGLVQSAAGSDAHAQLRSKYLTKQSIDLYPTAGSSDDFALNTQLEKDPTPDPRGDKVRIKTDTFPVFAFTMEVGAKDGSDGEFWPSIASSSNQYLKVRREAQFAIIAMLKYAATWSPPAMAAATGSSGSTSKGCCSMIIFLITFASLSVFLLFYWFL